MSQELERARARVNHTRYQLGRKAGHYESFFQRANHPTRPLAFWIRYTIFSPAERPEDAFDEVVGCLRDPHRRPEPRHPNKRVEDANVSLWRPGVGE